MRTTHPGPVQHGRHGQPAVLVAHEVLLLWPRGLDRRAATITEANLWPVFVVVVGERPQAESVTPLFDLLDQPKHAGELKVVTGQCHWSIVDPRHALLRLAVTATAPVRFATEIIVPATPVLGILDVVARGATVGVTTTRHAQRLNGTVDIRQALHEVVLFSSPPSSELAVFARVMGDA